MFHFLGLDNPSGPIYLFWSGVFGDVTIIGAVIALYCKHNCHRHHCPKIGKHIYKGIPYCGVHHPALGRDENHTQ